MEPLVGDHLARVGVEAADVRTSAITRRPVRSRATNTITSSASAASCSTSPVDQSRPPARAYTGSRGNTDHEESAWIVHIDPAMPWVIASNMSITSGPRTSPTTIRRGVNRLIARPEIGERHRADAFGVGAALHEHEHVVVPARRRVEVQLGFLLEHDDPLVGSALVQQRPQQGRLADALPAGDQHVAAGSHQRGEQRRQALVVHAAADQVLLVGVDEEVAADREVRALGHPRRRGEAGAVGELQVEDRARRRELPLHVPAPPGEGLDLLDQLRVACGAIGSPNSVSPSISHEADVVAAVDEDVGHVVACEQPVELRCRRERRRPAPARAGCPPRSAGELAARRAQSAARLRLSSSRRRIARAICRWSSSSGTGRPSAAAAAR